MNKRFFTYRDFWLRLVVSVLFAVFFVFLGSDSLTTTIQGKYFVADLLAAFSLSFLVTTSINIVIVHLDKQYPWNRYLFTRLIYQLIAAVLLPSLFILGFMYTYLIVLLGFEKNDVQFFTTEFPISVLFVIFWNLVYLSFYFFRENKQQKEELLSLKQQLYTFQNIETGAAALPTIPENPVPEPEEDKDTEVQNWSTKVKILVAVSGNKNIPIPVDNIACFYKTGNYTTLKTFHSDTYLLNHTLDELAKLLDETLFFRANRQFIINLKACHFFTNEENGKLAISLGTLHDEEVIISQKKAAVFKDWLNR